MAAWQPDPHGDWADLLHDSGECTLAQQKRVLQWTDADGITAANALLIFCKRAATILSAAIARQGEAFVEAGGFRERMSAVRLEARDAKQQEEGAPACPLCGKPMRRMMAHRGRNAGNAFWSCTGYPECRGTRSI